MKSTTPLILFTLFLLIGGCDNSHVQNTPEPESVLGDNGASDQPLPTIDYEPASCEPADTKPFVHRVMRDIYYWYDTVPENVNYDDFDTPELLLNSLLNKPKDRFSFLMNASDAQVFQDGQQIGLGLVWGFDASGALRVNLVLANSPAAEAGIERGDITFEINGKTIAQHVEEQADEETILGPNKEGIKVDLVIKKHNQAKDKPPVNITLTKTKFKPPSVSKADTLATNDQKIGYLAFDFFAASSIDELTQSFAKYKSEGISELILDLRYNGGGDLSAAHQLASLIWGYNSGTEEFARGYFNDKYASFNQSQPFSLLDNRVNLNRVFVLTGRSTASSSELVINSLKPYMEVIQIGAATDGKPYAMQSFPFCDKVLLPITFELKNALDQGEYYDGIKPDCLVTDDFDHKLGDTSEGLLDQALHYIANGSCKETDSTSRTLPLSNPYSREEMEALLRSINGPQDSF
jgi:C-terminal peptidase prc